MMAGNGLLFTKKTKDEIEDKNELTVGQVLIIPLNSYHNNTPITHRIE